MFQKPSLRVIDGIHDYIGENVENDYVENYEAIAIDDIKKRIMPDEVKHVLLNCCELAIGDVANSLNSSISNLKVCDIGSAYGFIINAVPAKRKVALDISLQYLRLVDPSVVRIRTNAEDIPLEDSYFDVVICTDVFEHVQNAEKLSNEISRIIKLGGTLLLATPWQQDLSVYDTEEYVKSFKKYKYVHLRSVDEEMINKHFYNFMMIASSMITIGMKYMKIKPYPIRFMQLKKIQDI